MKSEKSKAYSLTTKILKQNKMKLYKSEIGAAHRN